VALSLPEGEVTAGLARLFDTVAEGKRVAAELRATLRRERICRFREAGQTAAVYADITPADLRPYAEEAAALADGRVLILLPEEGGVRYAIASRTEDVRPLGAALHAALGGRGGGKPPLVQGSIPVGAEAVLAAWEAL
jgi:alanyl-tRNA synthetase